MQHFFSLLLLLTFGIHSWTIARFSLSSWFERWTESSDDDILFTENSFVSSVHGVGLEIERHFVNGDHMGFFSCIEDGTAIPFSYVNDGYCDCRDGTDEPGTAACSSHEYYRSFTCANNLSISIKIPASRVNDGICDCCDGSDEYFVSETDTTSEISSVASDENKSKIISKCPNSCEEEGRAWRQEIKNKLASFKKGAKARTTMVEQGHHANINLEAKESKASASYEASKSKYNTIKSQYEEMQEKLKGDNEILLEKIKTTLINCFSNLFLSLPDQTQRAIIISASTFNQLHGIDIENERVKHEISYVINIASKNDVKQFLNALDLLISNEEQETCPILRINDDEDFSVTDDNEGDNKEQQSDNDTDYSLEFLNDGDIVSSTEDKSLTMSIPSKYLEIDLLDPAIVGLRKQMQMAEVEYKKTESEWKKISEELNEFYGPDWVLYSLKGKCLTYKTATYSYEVCLFGNATQKQIAGGSSVKLGKWGGIEQDSEISDNLVMKWINGTKCWNGPQRALSAKLECSDVDKIIQFDEPEPCSYTCIIATPAACINPPTFDGVGEPRRFEL